MTDRITDEQLDEWERALDDSAEYGGLAWCNPIPRKLIAALRDEREKMDWLRNLLFEVWSFPVALEHLPGELVHLMHAALKDTAP